MKLKREALLHYVRQNEDKPWFLLGVDNEEMAVEMNGSFEQVKDVTGNNRVSDSGYQPQLSQETYYANPEDSIYEFLKDLALNRKSGDECKAQYMEVIIEDTEDEAHQAWIEDCKIEVVSYGGGTNGLNIPFNVWPDGNREEGTAKIVNKVPTYQAAGL